MTASTEPGPYGQRFGGGGSSTQPWVRLLSLPLRPEPPGADPHAVVVWGGRSAMTALTRFGTACLAPSPSRFATGDNTPIAPSRLHLDSCESRLREHLG